MTGGGGGEGKKWKGQVLAQCCHKMQKRAKKVVKKAKKKDYWQRNVYADYAISQKKYFPDIFPTFVAFKIRTKPW